MGKTSVQARIKWLIEQPKEDLVLDAGCPEFFSQPQFVPDNQGTGRFDMIQLSMGLMFARSYTRLGPGSRGRMLLLKRVSVGAEAPILQIQTLRGGRVFQQFEGSAVSYLYEDGFDFFCHGQQREVSVWGEGGCTLDMVTLVVDIAVLDSIVGPEERSFLLQALGIERMPSSIVRGMPRHLSSVLRSAMPASFTGACCLLEAEARGLEYLSGLLEHLRGVQPEIEADPGLARAVLRLKDELLQVEGRLPTLVSLARDYEMSARQLNLAFTRVFGESIFSFITVQRLEQARIALQETDIPMKVLASRLGYSHVNHFITAFRRRFGQPPGRLRKGSGGSSRQTMDP